MFPMMDTGFLVFAILFSLVILGSLIQVIRCIVKKEFKTKFAVFLTLFIAFSLMLVGLIISFSTKYL